MKASDAASANAVAVIYEVFGKDDGGPASRVADCESGGDGSPGREPITIHEDATNGVHAGGFQISRRWHVARAKRLGHEWSAMFTIRPNAEVAEDLHDEQGWGPWTCGWAA